MTNTKKRVVFTQGGKGGVGKTTLANDMADWYRGRGISVKMLDFDWENEAASGFSFFNKEAEKFNINEPGSLDAILAILDDSQNDVMLIDQAAASGQKTFEWFAEVGETAREMGIVFTSVGLVTADPGSVESVMKWTAALDDTADYLIVKNKMENPSEQFSAWHKNKLAQELSHEFDYREVVMGSRLAEFEELIRTTGVTPAQAAEAKKGELASTRWKIRAKSYAKQAGEMLDSVSDLLLPPESDEATQ